MADFDGFVEALKTELIEFAEYSWKAYKNSAIDDGGAFIERSKDDLERWTKMLANGGLTRDDFEWLMAGKKDLVELAALKQKGLAKVALDRFVNGLIDTIVSTAFKVFL
ncbi:hypothetical protein GCM10007860_06390 [Chitiniphilus shinanonensis]|uniref:Uncharacterized protein n=1 Tax=Chitiniphilus shinanonensis TaxID=553088 RepID=A0ABQ6BNA6_9NEIS|nr:hypothetical protein [Chitiniphilus shinanonensis]GLS03495.1 hypothetical protein GCM10007860_06390 [Chitiniphilus shinanonensis]